MVVIARDILPRRVVKYLARGGSQNVIVRGNRLYHSPYVVKEQAVDEETGVELPYASYVEHRYCHWFDAAGRDKGECDGGFQKYFDSVNIGLIWKLRRHYLICTEHEGISDDAPGVFTAWNDCDDLKSLYPAVWRALALCCPHPKFLNFSSKTYRFFGDLSIEVIVDAGAIEACRFFDEGCEVDLEQFLRAALEFNGGEMS